MDLDIEKGNHQTRFKACEKVNERVFLFHKKSEWLYATLIFSSS
jgi:hypothetical protein